MPLAKPALFMEAGGRVRPADGASVLSLLLVIVFFLVIQRRFVEGVATTGLN